MQGIDQPPPPRSPLPLVFFSSILAVRQARSVTLRCLILAAAQAMPPLIHALPHPNHNHNTGSQAGKGNAASPPRPFHPLLLRQPCPPPPPHRRPGTLLPLGKEEEQKVIHPPSSFSSSSSCSHVGAAVCMPLWSSSLPPRRWAHRRRRIVVPGRLTQGGRKGGRTKVDRLTRCCITQTAYLSVCVRVCGGVHCRCFIYRLHYILSSSHASPFPPSLPPSLPSFLSRSSSPAKTVVWMGKDFRSADSGKRKMR